MSRGKQLKTKVKETLRHNRAEAVAIELAKEEANQVIRRKRDPLDWLAERFEKALDRVDPLKALAVMGTTIVVHDIIFKLSEFSSQVTALRPDIFVSTTMWRLAGIPEDKINEMTGGVSGGKVDPDVVGYLASWLVAFAIAYFLIEHGGELLGIGKMFFGATK